MNLGASSFESLQFDKEIGKKEGKKCVELLSRH